jgi:hypothetical protein
MSADQNDLWVFRDARKTISRISVLGDLHSALQRLFDDPQNRHLYYNALIQAGELESALADSDSESTESLADLTDALAFAAFRGSLDKVKQLANALDHIACPNQLITSPSEGFAYYALNPLDIAKPAQESVAPHRPAAVIGIRSIGTTLSAVATAALISNGYRAARITVRPEGDPYDRVLRFTPPQSAWIKKLKENAAQFLVVDEGPGRSGSTFLSVGEALISSGIAAEDIVLLGSREPDLNTLCAQEAASRWKKFEFRTFSADTCNGFRDCTYIGGGEWRKHFLSAESSWPACWPQMERLKFLSQDRSQLFKFDGLGPAGDAVRNRAHALAAAGFGCAIEDVGEGFSRYAVIDGSSLHFSNISAAILERIAQYCAFRSAEFHVEHGTPEPLAEMLRVNLLREFEWEIDFDPELLRPQNMVVVDGRMNPHEWLFTANGRLLKTDGATHGDDHFFPGLTDIAWDIAGAAVEWNLDSHALEFLLSRYRLLTGEDLHQSLQVFLLAYSVFRLAWCKMALPSVRGTAEEFCLTLAYRYYREHIETQLPQGIDAVRRDFRTTPRRDKSGINACQAQRGIQSVP